MRNRLLLPLLIAFILFSCNKKHDSNENVVHLKGQIVTTDNVEVKLRYDGASSFLGDSHFIQLKLDDQGYFDTTFVLNEPTYYRILSNTLYLSPGDDLTVKITNDYNEAEFSGIGAEANTYLKGCPFPHDGSYLRLGENLTGDFMATKATMDSLAEIRIHQLDTLTNVSDAFKKMETARIKGDIINGYAYYPYYTSFALTMKKIDTIPEWNGLLETIGPYVYPILKEINDPAFLDISVIRDVFSFSRDSLMQKFYFKDILLPTRTEELVSSYSKVNTLDYNYNDEIVNELTLFSQSLENKDFADEIDNRLNKVKRLLPGQPAFDIEFVDTIGNTKRLSDFKGKVLYVDLWATWCGPCLQESPYFENLSEQFNTEEVSFIPISIDYDNKEWLKFLRKNPKNLTQYHSSDKILQKGWNLQFVPRFLLIDRDFNIVNSLASPPSTDEAKLAINQLLGK